MSNQDDVEEIRLFELRTSRARELLETGAPAWILVNPVEYHGSHLSLHNDRLVSLGLSRGTARRFLPERGWPLLWANDFEAGVNSVHGPGSQPVGFEAVASLVVRACRGLVELGATRVVIVTFHGDPRHNLAIQRGVDLLESLGVRVLAPTAWLMQNIIHLDPTRLDPIYATVADPDVRAEMHRLASHDFHAGFLETSLTMSYARETVRGHESVLPSPTIRPDPRIRRIAAAIRTTGAAELADELDYAAVGLAWLHQRPFPGYTGRPALANEEAGARLADHFEETYADLCRAVLLGRERSPRPPFRWLDPTARPSARLRRLIDELGL